MERLKESLLLSVVPTEKVISNLASINPPLQLEWVYLKKNDHLVLILCGSVSSWIDRNLLSSTGFMGRISFTLTLEELSLRESNLFWNKSGALVSPYEKFKILSITGGVPRYLEEIDYTQSADHNIQELCFKKGGVLTTEFDKIFSDLFSKRNKIYRDIVEAFVDGPVDIQTVCDRLKVKRSGLISSYLDDLVKANFLSRDFTWSIKSGKSSLLSHFRLKDNYLRFYLKFIEPHLNLIHQDAFRDRSLSSLLGWSSIMELQFENLVVHNRFLLQKALNIFPEDIIFDNPYFQKKTQTHAGCQIDYMIQTKFNNLFACEVKYSKNEIGPAVISEMQEKLSRLKLPRRFSAWPVLVHVNGVSEAVEDSGYFSKIIDFSQFLSSS